MAAPVLHWAQEILLTWKHFSVTTQKSIALRMTGAIAIAVVALTIACGAPKAGVDDRFKRREFLPTSEHAAFVAPRLEGRVNDFANKLTSADRASLEGDLAAFDRATTNEIAILILPSLGGHTIEDVAYTTAKAWKLGKRGRDNGVLVVIAVEERRVRIETGRGIGDVLTDLRASEIIETMKPALRSGDYALALRTAIAAIERSLAASDTSP